MIRSFIFSLPLTMSALSDCSGSSNSSSDPIDWDGDGYDETVDCDDRDASISPAGAEVCDGIDNDCDGFEDITGTAAWVGVDGMLTDMSAELGAGTWLSPVSLSLSADGELRFCGGTWYSNITVDGVTVDIVDLYAEAVIDGSLEDSVVNAINGADLIIGDVTLTGGYSTLGGGVYVDASTVQLDGVTITDNASAISGGGVYAIDSVVAVSDSSITVNDAVFYGGGVAGLDSVLSFDGADVSTNTAYDYGAGMYFEGSVVDFYQSSATDNLVEDYGAAVYLYDADMLVEDSSIIDNLAGYSGSGFFLDLYGDLVVVNTQVYNAFDDAVTWLGLSYYTTSYSVVDFACNELICE